MIPILRRRSLLLLAAVGCGAGFSTFDRQALAQEPAPPAQSPAEPGTPVTDPASLTTDLALPTTEPTEPAEPPAEPSPSPPLPPAESSAEPAAAPVEPAPAPAPVPAETDESGESEEEEVPENANLPRRDSFLPRLDVYFPEGDLDLRVSRLINKVFFEGQVKYNFIKGDITAFLRYRYYGYKRTTQFTVFDSIEFADVEDFSSDFDRVRGALMLWQWPHSYHYRTFALVELDRISSNREVVTVDGEPIEGTLVRDGRTNTFIRFGYQIGTPDDARSNALAGERRARNERLFTAARDIGPGGTGFTAAATYSFDQLGGDFSYIRAEVEALKRFDLTDRTFLIGRLSGGSFLAKKVIEIETDSPRLPEVDLFTIPRGEYFNLEGRDNLKGVSEDRRGTEKLFTTWELFFPWFLGDNRPFLRANWQNWYWVLYGGYGAVGFDRKELTDFSFYTPDVGIGFESSLRIRKYNFFLSGILAQALKGGGGPEARLSVKSYR